jgi:putative solute:sodium symporter small subunit
MNEVTGPFGYPWTYWFTCQGSLGIFVILCFWFANRQEKIDEEFGFNERGDQ